MQEPYAGEGFVCVFRSGGDGEGPYSEGFEGGESGEGCKTDCKGSLRQSEGMIVLCSVFDVHCLPFQQYFDPTEKKPTNGYGFIEPRDPPSYGAPKKSVQLAELQRLLPQLIPLQILLPHGRDCHTRRIRRHQP